MANRRVIPGLDMAAVDYWCSTDNGDKASFVAGAIWAVEQGAEWYEFPETPTGDDDSGTPDGGGAFARRPVMGENTAGATPEGR